MRKFILASAAAATVATGIGLAISSPAFAQAGSYQRSCRTYNTANGVLTAECADAQGRYHASTLSTAQCRGDISNQNGMLSCPGGQASGGQLVQQGGQPQGGQPQGGRGQAQGYGAPPQGPGGPNYDQRRDDRRDDRAAAAVAGAVAGALLGANGQPVAPPPAYGDQRYGDPRFDYRYQQGWWGYGHRPGEWVRIHDRADWMEMRINRAQEQGRLSRGDARDLRRQLYDIQNRERDLLGYGRLGPRQRDELDHRFNDLTDEIRRDARED